MTDRQVNCNILGNIMEKRILSTILVLCMVLTLLPEMAFATEAENISRDADATGEFGGHTYEMFDDSISWDDAQAECEDRGGHLVTINSEEEQQFLTDLIKSSTKKNMWIGAYMEEGQYYWVTGEDFSYTNWAPGEPNNVFNMQHRAMMYTQNAAYEAGTWNDENTNGRDWPGYYLSDFGYICEWDRKDADAELNIGDYVILGKYNGQPIKWRCVDIDENGPLMLSDKILSFKCFDGSGDSDYHYVSGAFSSIRKQYGSNCYVDSNIRQWLNSTDDSVDWTHNAPVSSNVYEGYNSYADEAGFLSEGNFTQKELMCMKSVTQKVYTNTAESVRGVIDGGTREHFLDSGNIQNLDYDFEDCFYQNISDRVFIPNLLQIKAVYDNFDNGSYIAAYPTVEALQNSNYNGENTSSTETFNYWINHPGTTGYCYEWVGIISTEGETSACRAYYGTIGVRPAFYLDTEFFMIAGGSGSEENSYYIAEQGKLDFTSDEAIIAEVTKYTSDELYAQWNAIINSGLSSEEKFKRLNELSHNNGLTDAKEGIQYLSEVSSHRRDYLYLTTNENYCAFNWWYWLNTTVKGKIARGLLYTDGLIFNFELADYIDWTTYANSSYPGVEKCKTMLKDFMEAEDDEILATGNAKKITKEMKNAIKLNNIVADAEAEEIMANVMNAKTNEQLEKYQQQFADWLIRQARIQQKIESDGEVRLYLGAESISKALDYAAPIINFAAATAEDVVGMMSLENDIKKYEEYDEFLTTIYSDPDVSKEMRIAAYQLHDDIENGYIKKVQSILSNFITLEIDMIYMDKSLLSTYLESKGLSATTTNLLGEAMGTITIATVISNIVINTGDFVKQAAYTMSYAELATLYSLKLQEDRDAFRESPTAENAWQFYEDYNLLWRLRYKGEEQYLKMNVVKAFVFGKIKTLGYGYKEEVVNDVLNVLKQCKFEFADRITVPKSLQYIKKTVIECPVDVLIYTKEGILVAELKDGIISDTVNDYGRFAVVYESYSGEYAKVICQSSDVELDIKMVSVADGLVDYKFSQTGTGDMLSFDKVCVEKGDVIEVLDNHYRIIHNNGMEDEPQQFDTLSEEYLKPESISMEETSLELLVGEEKTLNISVLPDTATNKSVEWYSEDEKIANVKNGVVIGEAVGETVIWVKACDSEEVENSITVKIVKETPAVTEIFRDVSKGQWYVDAIQYVYDKAIMEGNDDKFTPNGKMTRAMFVTTLYRLAGEPEITDYSALEELKDVSEGAWYTDAVCWAYSTKVTTGYESDRTFRMNTALTREQLATFLYRYAENQELDIAQTDDLSGLLNADKVKAYALNEMKWAVGAGLVSGLESKDENGVTVYDLAPQGNATRAQMASILMRFCEAYHI